MQYLLFGFRVYGAGRLDRLRAPIIVVLYIALVWSRDHRTGFVVFRRSMQGNVGLAKLSDAQELLLSIQLHRHELKARHYPVF